MSYPGLQSPPRRRNCLTIGCGGCLLVILAIAAVFGAMYYYGRKSITPTCDQYLALVDQANYQAAYNSLASQWKAKQTYAEFEQFEKDRFAATGPVQKTTMTGMSVHSDLSGSYAAITYSVDFAKTTGRIVFNLTKENGRWAILGANYDSPALAGFGAFGNISSHTTSTLNQPNAATSGTLDRNPDRPTSTSVLTGHTSTSAPAIAD